jgi:hypothetical protein
MRKNIYKQVAKLLGKQTINFQKSIYNMVEQNFKNIIAKMNGQATK